MKVSSSTQFIIDMSLAYFGTSILKILCMPLVTNFCLRTIHFSAFASSTGTLIGRKAVSSFSHADFDPFSETPSDPLAQAAILVLSGTVALLMTQSHPFVPSFPKFMRLSIKDCMILGVTQTFCIAVQLLSYFFPFLKGFTHSGQPGTDGDDKVDHIYEEIPYGWNQKP